MSAAQRALLDRLLGKHRDATSDERAKLKTLKWSDRQVCQNYVTGFCPNELFANTKSDLGTCPFEHDPMYKAEYEAEADATTKRRCEQRFLRVLEDLRDGCDRTIARGQERFSGQLADTKLDPQKQAIIREKEIAILKLQTEMEKRGEEGDVEGARAIMVEVDALQLQIREVKGLTAEGRANTGNVHLDALAEKEKRMRVCDVCGGFLVINDADQRTINHLTGKQHTGFLKIRQTVEALRTKLHTTTTAVTASSTAAPTAASGTGTGAGASTPSAANGTGASASAAASGSSNGAAAAGAGAGAKGPGAAPSAAYKAKYPSSDSSRYRTPQNSVHYYAAAASSSGGSNHTRERSRSPARSSGSSRYGGSSRSGRSRSRSRSRSPRRR